MRKVYLIALFNAKTKEYVATINEVYATKHIANLAKEKLVSATYIYSIIKCDMIIEKEYIK